MFNKNKINKLLEICLLKIFNFLEILIPQLGLSLEWYFIFIFL